MEDIKSEQCKFINIYKFMFSFKVTVTLSFDLMTSKSIFGH